MSQDGARGPVRIPSGRGARGQAAAPPSKSHAIRALVCAALQSGFGETTFTSAPHPLPWDVVNAVGALRSLGWETSCDGRTVRVRMYDDPPLIENATLDVGGSATALRFLAALCALGPGPYMVGGSEQLLRRPAGALVEALRSLGVTVNGAPGEGGGLHPPLTIAGGPPRGDEVTVDASESSHALSALLLIGPMLPRGLIVRPRGPVVSLPYVALTVRTMRRWGAVVEERGTTWFAAPGGYDWHGGPGGDPDMDGGRVVGDWSSAAFLLGTAAATGGDVEVTGLDRDDTQADRAIVGILRTMGCTVTETKDGVRCRGRVAHAVDVDLHASPDLAPLVGALACLAPGTSRVRGAAHLRIKETDRIAEVVRCAGAFGCEAVERPDGFEITGRARHGAEIDPAGDHRLAMAFAVAGLAVPGTRIVDPDCVAKSYPAFWEDLARLVGDPGGLRRAPPAGSDLGGSGTGT